MEKIAHYRILKRIGRGGMGIVFRAEDIRDGRIVALKVIRDAEAAGGAPGPNVAEARIRFEREAEILKSLLHLNIVSFLEIGEEDGTPYLAMEFLDGRPLGSFAGQPYTETVPLLIQAAHGMEYLASRGIVHRDLSPDNIFVVSKGDEKIVKLLDFGIAKLFEDSGGPASLTATGFFLGKVAYGSPEQLGAAGSSVELDWRSDAYSLGVIFYQVLSGRRPFEGKAPIEYIAAHLNLPAPPVAAPPGAPPLPMELVRLIAQMLEKRLEARPKSYREIIDRLVAVARAGTGAHESLAGAPATLPEVSGNDRVASVRVGGSEETRPTELVNREPRVPESFGTRAGRGLAARFVASLAVVLVSVGFLIWMRLTKPVAPRPVAGGRPSPASPRLAATPPPAPAPLTTASAAKADSTPEPAVEGATTPGAEPVSPLQTPSSSTPSTAGAPVADATAMGNLSIFAFPRALIEEIVAIPSGLAVPLSKGAGTPWLSPTPLAAGRYRITLRYPQLNGRVDVREATVTEGQTTMLNGTVASIDELVGSLK